MSNRSEKMRYLLDRNVVRHAIAGLRYGRVRPLTREEMDALAFWRTMEQQGGSLFISHTSFHILRRPAGSVEAQTLLDSTEVRWPTQYYARWPRRRHETTGLTREDCAQVALSSFGSTLEGSILGVHFLVTCDQSLIAGYRGHRVTLDRRLHAMTVQLRVPFNQAALPQLIEPKPIP